MISKVATLFILTAVTLGHVQAQSSTASDAQLIDELNTYMNRVTELGFSGGVIVYRDGEVLLSEGYGDANREAGTPYSNETVFPVGSVTKQFTGAAIMRLVMAGKVNPDDLITEYFRDVPDDKSGITVHQLLTHSAGLPQALGYDFAVIGEAEYIQQAMESELKFTPGTSYSYSNVGFSLLASIVEQVSGQSLSDFADAELFEPAGMTKTGYRLDRFDPAKMAHGYKGGVDWGSFADKAWDEDGPYWHLRGNGAMLSTLGDMMRWHVALLGNDILSEEAKEAYFAPHVLEGAGAPSSYGYGWVNQQTPRGLLIWHDGGNPYFSTEFRRYLDAGIAIVVTANTNEKSAMRTMGAVADIVFGDPYDLPPLEEVTIDPARLGDTPEGRRSLAVLDLFAGSADDVDAFLTEHLAPRLFESNPRARLIEGFSEDQSRIGAVEIGKIIRLGERKLELIIHSEGDGRWRSLTVTVDDDAPHQITGVGVDQASAPKGWGENSGTDAATAGNEDGVAGRDWGLPNSPGGRVLGKFLDAVTSGNRETYSQYVQSSFAPGFLNDFPLAEHISQFVMMNTDIGENPEVVGANRPNDSTVKLRLKSAEGSILTISIEIDSEDRVAGIGLDM